MAFTWTAITAKVTKVDDAHVKELVDNIDALAGTIGIAKYTWTADLAAIKAGTGQGMKVKQAHLTELRNATTYLKNNSNCATNYTTVYASNLVSNLTTAYQSNLTGENSGYYSTNNSDNSGEDGTYGTGCSDNSTNCSPDYTNHCGTDYTTNCSPDNSTNCGTDNTSQNSSALSSNKSPNYSTNNESVYSSVCSTNNTSQNGTAKTNHHGDYCTGLTL